MAHARFTKEAVFEAADQLLAEGEKPTITRIRDIIGGGSPNDITAWMKEWRTRQQKITDAQQIPAPGNIKDQASVFLTEFVTTIWNTARTEANNKLKAERQALSDAQAALELETSDALEVAESLNIENAELKTQIASLEETDRENTKKTNELLQQLDLSKNAFDDLTKERDRLERELTASRSEAKEALANASQLTSELTELRRSDNELKSELEALKTQAESFKRECDIALAEKETAQKELESVKAELKSLQKENNSLNAQVDKQQTALDAAARRTDELQIELKDARVGQGAAELESAELRGELRALAALKADGTKEST